MEDIILIADEFGQEHPFLIQHHLELGDKDFLVLAMILDENELAEESILVHAIYDDGELELIPVEDDEVIDYVEEILNDL